MYAIRSYYEVIGQLLFVHAIGQLVVEDREAGLHALEEVAVHPVGAGAEHLGLAAVLEVASYNFV